MLDLERFETAEVIFKFIQSHSYRYHLIDHL